MKNISKVTILIPTHNRHNYLPRCVDWFIKGQFNIVIADSTDKPWDHTLTKHERVTYINYPGAYDIYVDKVLLALQHINTPYVAMCADDDFILFSGLDHSVAFLENHDDYSFCQGYAYLFQKIGGHHAVWPMMYDFHDIESSDWLQRLVEPKSTVFYGVNRTSSFLNIFQFLCDLEISHSIGSAGLIDFTLTSISAKNGKFKRLKIPFALREYSVSAGITGARFRLLLDAGLPEFYKELLFYLVSNIEEEKERVRSSILRIFAEDFSGQLKYDLLPDVDRRHKIRNLPKSLQNFSELGVRWLGAVRGFKRKGYWPAINLFSTEEYSLFKKQVRDFPV